MYTDMSFNQFKDLSGRCWGEDNHGFLIIDKNRAWSNGRYRKGLDSFIINMRSNWYKISVCFYALEDKDDGIGKRVEYFALTC